MCVVSIACMHALHTTWVAIYQLVFTVFVLYPELVLICSVALTL